jgi:hypothetical protein
MSIDHIDTPRPMFTSPEVAQMIVSGENDFNYYKWKTLTDAEKAWAFDDIVTFISNQRGDKGVSREMNLASHYVDLMWELEKKFDRWAANEISASSYIGMVEP